MEWIALWFLAMGVGIGYYGGYQQGWAKGRYELRKEREEAERLR
jgi:hypothetical protein